jgi:hypothetical protein
MGAPDDQSASVTALIRMRREWLHRRRADSFKRDAFDAGWANRKSRIAAPSGLPVTRKLAKSARIAGEMRSSAIFEPASTGAKRPGTTISLSPESTMPERIVPMIHVPNVGATAEWYASIGFEICNVYRKGDDDEIDWALLRLGQSDLMLNAGGLPSSASRRDFDLYTHVDDVDAVRKRVDGKAEIIKDLHAQHLLRNARIRHPRLQRFLDYLRSVCTDPIATHPFPFAVFEARRQGSLLGDVSGEATNK